MGICIILNGRLYHFESDVDLDEILSKHADGQHPTCRFNDVKYDYELPSDELKNIHTAYM